MPPLTVRGRSERFVVSIAASCPNLRNLKLERISRSTLHAPELVGAFPFIPLVCGDEDIPAHPLLGSELYLPNLLRLPTLRSLSICDTHLGDSRWLTTPSCGRIQALDIGTCCHETEETNSLATEHVMASATAALEELSLSTAVSTERFLDPLTTPLSNLQKVHLTTYFPADVVVDTLANLAGSLKVETVSVQCYEEDIVDMCEALSEFLALRVERTEGKEPFYENLRLLDVSVVPIQSDIAGESAHERLDALTRLAEFCLDLKVQTSFCIADNVASSSRPSHLAPFLCMDEPMRVDFE
jgi:hypothetical protein